MRKNDEDLSIQAKKIAKMHVRFFLFASKGGRVMLKAPAEIDRGRHAKTLFQGGNSHEMQKNYFRTRVGVFP